MVGCQPRIANSLEISMQRGGSRAIETEPATSIARSISETLAGDHAILALRQSGGLALSATEEEINDAQQLMCRHGFHVEAASAVTVACVPKLVSERGLRGDETVVCILTGPGFRW
jgi:threonine synthase